MRRRRRPRKLERENATRYRDWHIAPSCLAAGCSCGCWLMTQRWLSGAVRLPSKPAAGTAETREVSHARTVFRASSSCVDPRALYSMRGRCTARACHGASRVAPAAARPVRRHEPSGRCRWRRAASRRRRRTKKRPWPPPCRRRTRALPERDARGVARTHAARAELRNAVPRARLNDLWRDDDEAEGGGGGGGEGVRLRTRLCALLARSPAFAVWRSIRSGDDARS